MLVSAEVRKELERFIVAKLWTGPGAAGKIGGPDGQGKADENDKARALYGAQALPMLVLVDSDGVVRDVLPHEDAADFLITKELLLEALRKIR